jgi:hypothetical protein
MGREELLAATHVVRTAHPARSAYARFLAFSARTGLIAKGSNGSIPALQYSVQTNEPNRKIQAQKP